MGGAVSGSLFDDDDISAVPAGEFVPHHYLSIPAVLALPPNDPGVRAAIAAWLDTNEPSTAMLLSLLHSEFADLAQANGA